MNFYRYKTPWKLVLLVFAVIIGLFSLLYTQNLVKKLKAEERKKVELWAEATRQIKITRTIQRHGEGGGGRRPSDGDREPEHHGDPRRAAERRCCGNGARDRRPRG